MEKNKLDKLKIEIKNLHNSVSKLKEHFPIKKSGFTLDGRLVGDIGEIVAQELFQINLYEKVVKYYDAETTYKPNLKIQIKATFKESLTYNHEPDYYIGIKLFEDGNFKVIYNGPGKYIHENYSHRKHIGKKLLLFPIKQLEALSLKIEDSERILLRDNKLNNY